MPKFNKTINQLETKFEKWLYIIKNLNKLDRLPAKLKENVFEKLFKAAEIAKFTPEQYKSYENSLKHYRDLKNSIDTAKDEGIEIGVQIGKKQRDFEIAKKMLKNNIDIESIVKITNLTKEEIKNCK